MAYAAGVDVEVAVVPAFGAGANASGGDWEVDDELAYGGGVFAGVTGEAGGP